MNSKYDFSHFIEELGKLEIVLTDQQLEQFEKYYQELREQNMKGLIVDLRNNPGGLLDAVVDTLRQILPEGLVVYMQTKDGTKTEYTCDGDTPIDIPMVVLVNEYSASASEIFAGAVHDYGIGTLVGNTTYGKGIVQKTFPFSDGSAVKMTIAYYYTPNGTCIHGEGIEPDVKVMAVIKTDGYGHGAVEIGKYLKDDVDYYEYALTSLD